MQMHMCAVCMVFYLNPKLLISKIIAPPCRNNAALPFFFPVVRHSAFNLGSDADLICSDKTWNETIFVIWNIKLKSKDCKISFSNDGQSVDFCNDDKSLLNNSRAQSYLHIPNFSHGDVGIYKCESVYKGGIENYEINVDITGRTFLLAGINDFKNHVVHKINLILNSAYL